MVRDVIIRFHDEICPACHLDQQNLLFLSMQDLAERLPSQFPNAARKN